MINWRDWRARLMLSPIVRAGKAAGQRAHQVAAQGLAKARLTGAQLARRIVAVQKAAGLDTRLMRESARSVIHRPMTRESDRAWQAAYAREAERHVPGLAPKCEPAMVPAAPAGPARPVWPHAGPSGPIRTDWEAGQ